LWAFRIAQLVVITAVVAPTIAVVQSPWANNSVNARMSEYFSVTGKLAGHEPDRIDPGFHTEIDVDAFRRAGRALPPGARYLLALPARALVFTDVVSATRIYAPWAIPVSDPAKADWVLAYDAPLPRVGRGFSEVRTWGSFLYLGRVRR
jgi:hypothetical protein